MPEVETINMSIRIKWFVHRHYLAIVSLILLITLLFAIVLYVKGSDWKLLLAVVGGLLSFVYFIQKQQLDEARLFKELFVQFNTKYDELNGRLNDIINEENTKKELKEIEGAINTLYDYFNLCGEEYLFYQKGFIYPEVWNSWVRGMNDYYKDSRIQKLWNEELVKGSYYGLSVDKEIKALSP